MPFLGLLSGARLFLIVFPDLALTAPLATFLLVLQPFSALHMVINPPFVRSPASFLYFVYIYVVNISIISHHACAWAGGLRPFLPALAVISVLFMRTLSANSLSGIAFGSSLRVHFDLLISWR